MLWLLISFLVTQKSTAWSWNRVQPSSTSSSHSVTAPRVSGHSAVTDHKNGQILLFGGLTGSAGSPCTDQLWRFGQNQNSNDNDRAAAWELVDTKNGPGPRMYAASAILGESLFLMGGWDPGEPKSGGVFLDETWRCHLDGDELQWELSEEDILPCGPVSRHAACTVGGNTMVMHTFRGVFVKTMASDGTITSWTEQATTGEGPEGLSMCGMTALTDESLLVYGGSTKTQQLSSDAFVLSTKTWKWTKLRSDSDEVPQARASPCAVHYGENKCVVFGGACLGGEGYDAGAGLQAQDDTWLLAVVDETKAIWERILVTSDDDECVPRARLAATLNVIPPSTPGYDGAILLSGGWDPKSGTFDDVWVLKP